MILWLALAALLLALGLHGLVTGQVRAKKGRRYSLAETPVQYTIIVVGYFGVVVLMVVLAAGWL